MNFTQYSIDFLKARLLETAQRHHMNLLHPEVVAVSQELDILIVQSMKSRQRRVS